MGLDIPYTFGQSPLDDDEKEGLKSDTVTTKRELDQLEQLNIEKAVEWTIHRRLDEEGILTEEFVKSIHFRMLGDVWDWAGSFRRSDKNLGVAWIHIGVELRKLLDDTKFWIRNNAYSPDEIAIRFKHRIVKIHCFPNGNGRHSRLMADIIIEKVFGKEVFSWRGSTIVKPDEIRKEYIFAIQQADNGDIIPLLKFARS